MRMRLRMWFEDACCSALASIGGIRSRVSAISYTGRAFRPAANRAVRPRAKRMPPHNMPAQRNVKLET